MSDLTTWVPESVLQARRAQEAEERRSARTTLARLQEEIEAFEASLTEHEEVAICLANFGHDVTISVESIASRNPELIVIHGADISTGEKVTQLIHQSQVNFLLRAKSVTGRPARRFTAKA